MGHRVRQKSHLEKGYPELAIESLLKTCLLPAACFLELFPPLPRFSPLLSWDQPLLTLTFKSLIMFCQETALAHALRQHVFPSHLAVGEHSLNTLDGGMIVAWTFAHTDTVIRKCDGYAWGGGRVACKVDTAYSEITSTDFSTREKATINVVTLGWKSRWLCILAEMQES